MYLSQRPSERNLRPSGRSRAGITNSAFSPSSVTLRNNRNWLVRLKSPGRAVPPRGLVPHTKSPVPTTPTLTKSRARHVPFSTLKKTVRSLLAMIQTLSVNSLSSTTRVKPNYAILTTLLWASTQTMRRPDVSSLFARMAQRRTLV